MAVRAENLTSCRDRCCRHQKEPRQKRRHFRRGGDGPRDRLDIVVRNLGDAVCRRFFKSKRGGRQRAKITIAIRFVFKDQMQVGALGKGRKLTRNSSTAPVYGRKSMGNVCSRDKGIKNQAFQKIWFVRLIRRLCFYRLADFAKRGKRRPCALLFFQAVLIS